VDGSFLRSVLTATRFQRYPPDTLLQPWITPSLFENTNNDAIIDEYTFGQMQDEDVARANLEKHWDTWITEDDFIAINAAGLSHVRYVSSAYIAYAAFLTLVCRIPLGYWSVPMTSSDTSGSTDVSPYLDGAWPFLLRGLNWARKHDVRVIVDIHGAPGSQNGYDNVRLHFYCVIPLDLTYENRVDNAQETHSGGTTPRTLPGPWTQ